MVIKESGLNNNPIVLNFSETKSKHSPTTNNMDSSSLTNTPFQVNLGPSSENHQAVTEFDFFKDYNNNDHTKVVVSPSAYADAAVSVFDIDRTNVPSFLDFKLCVSYSSFNSLSLCFSLSY